MTTATLEIERKVETMPENAFAPRPGLKVWVSEGIVPAEQRYCACQSRGCASGAGAYLAHGSPCEAGE